MSFITGFLNFSQPRKMVLFGLILYVPVNSLSVILGQVFLW